MPEIPAFQPDTDARHEIEIDRSYNPFRPSTANRDWEQLYNNFQRERNDALEMQSSLNTAPEDTDSGLDLLPSADMPEATLDLDTLQSSAATLQVKGRYIASPSKAGLLLVDQHRAHLKILYERYLDMYRQGTLTAQRVIFPEILRLSPAQHSIMESITGELSRVGFDLAYLGDTSWSINGVPSVIDSLNPTETIERMIDNVTETGADITAELHERLALSMARSAAVKSGQPLSPGEMDQILSDLTRLPDPTLTPDGLTVMKVIGLDEIGRMFG